MALLTRMTVFHMHLNPRDRNWLASYNGHTYMGVPGFRFFHAQHARPWNNRDGAWRVDADYRVNPFAARDAWACPEDEGYWYVGLPDAPTQELVRLIQAWGERLWRDGYVSTAGLRLIVEPPKRALRIRKP